ncbi:hypothetical protein AB4144_09270 [Rhizobiaceae sp. 2RAB30]
MVRFGSPGGPNASSRLEPPRFLIALTAFLLIATTLRLVAFRSAALNSGVDWFRLGFFMGIAPPFRRSGGNLFRLEMET